MNRERMNRVELNGKWEMGGDEDKVRMNEDEDEDEDEGEKRKKGEKREREERVVTVVFRIQYVLCICMVKWIRCG